MGNWNIGKRITNLMNPKISKTKYGEELITNLSRDLTRELGKGFSPRNLRSFSKFHKLYPKAKITSRLSWSHYALLLTIEDPQKRKSLETKAIQKKLTIRELRTNILRHQTQKSKKSPTDPKHTTLPRPILKLYQYATLTPLHNPSPHLDLGFSIIRSGHDRSTLSKPSPTPTQPTYTYKAYLKKIIDGDTLDVIIDLGFSIFITQRLRLKGLDTPELPTKEGIASKQFVEDRLKKAKFLIIKTHSHDKYDRYLVDVFYLEGDVTEDDVVHSGRFLNQEILDYGMGMVW
jgi:endonuclease YncB( thermonuclease family)